MENEKLNTFKAETLHRNEFDKYHFYKEIKEANNRGLFKIFIPHNVFVPDEFKVELMKNGFKVYVGDWDGVMKNSLIIEW